MIATLIVFGLTLLLTVLVWKFAFKPVVTISSLEEWNHQKLWINAKCFAMLVDSKEEMYLRQSLPPSLFRVVRRHRTLLAKECAARMGRNAAMLLQVAQRGTLDADPRNKAVARELARVAVRVRLHASLTVWCLRLKWLLPGADIRIPYRYLADNHLERSLASLVTAKSPREAMQMCGAWALLAEA